VPVVTTADSGATDGAAAPVGRLVTTDTTRSNERCSILKVAIIRPIKLSPSTVPVVITT